MATPRKLIFSLQLSLLAALLFLQSGCTPRTPVVNFLSPDLLTRGQQNVEVTLDGSDFATGGVPVIVVDEGNNDGITQTLTSFDDTHIILNVSVSSSAVLGGHLVSVYTHAAGCGYNYLHVQCNPPDSCPSAPELARIHPRHFVQGQTVMVTFEGVHLLGNSPAVEFSPEASGITIPQGTVINVTPDGQFDTFTIPLVVDPEAQTGEHRVRVNTPGGRGTWHYLDVEWYPPEVMPPSNIPYLESVGPSYVGPNVDVTIECDGIGFGTHRKVITTPDVTTVTYDVVNGEADPDRTVVAKIRPTTVGPIKVQVQNLDNNLVSDDYRIFVISPKPYTPMVTATSSGGVQRNGPPYTLEVTGDHADIIFDHSWPQYIPGLTFSNTQHLTPTKTTVTVTASSEAELTGNVPTNLAVSYIITDPNASVTTPGDSLPFSINVLPELKP